LGELNIDIDSETLASIPLNCITKYWLFKNFKLNEKN
jgi:hypothetical protein